MALKVTEDVLRAMASLNSENDANWIRVKKWIFEELHKHQGYAAFGSQLTNEWIRVYQGMAIILLELSTYAENADRELEILASKAERSDKPIQGVS